MRFISHRGAAGLAIENSLEAINKATHFKPEFIEIDIHRTKDGIFVLYHGDVRRTYFGKPLDETFEELKNRIPSLLTLDEFRRLAPKSHYMLDIKTKGHTAELTKELEKLPREIIGAFTSPHPIVLKELSSSFPDKKTFIAQPYTEGPVRPFELARKYKFSGVSLNKWWLGPFVHRLYRRYKLEMVVYTIDSRFGISLAGRFFPDIILCTNHPERISQDKPR